MNQDRNDNELERYLDGGSDESRRYAALGDQEPPPELDRRILAEAEQAVKVTRLPTRRAPAFKAFAWAAVVVLSFSVVLNIIFEQAMYEPVVTTEAVVGRSDIPVELVEQSAEAKAMKDERGRLPEAEAPVSAPVAKRQQAPAAVASYDQKSSARPEEFAAEADAVMLNEEVADSGLMSGIEEISVTVRRSSGAAAGKPDVGAPMMQIVADYLSQGESVDALANLSRYAEDKESSLQRIYDDYDAGHEDEALQALAEFRVEYPEHPVALALAERGF